MSLMPKWTHSTNSGTILDPSVMYLESAVDLEFAMIITSVGLIQALMSVFAFGKSNNAAFHVDLVNNLTLHATADASQPMSTRTYSANHHAFAQKSMRQSHVALTVPDLTTSALQTAMAMRRANAKVYQSRDRVIAITVQMNPTLWLATTGRSTPTHA